MEIGCFVSTAKAASHLDKDEKERSQLGTRHFFHLDDTLSLYLLHTTIDNIDCWEPYTMDDSSELSQVSKVGRSRKGIEPI